MAIMAYDQHLKNTRIEESYRVVVPGQGHEREL